MRNHPILVVSNFRIFQTCQLVFSEYMSCNKQKLFFTKKFVLQKIGQFENGATSKKSKRNLLVKQRKIFDFDCILVVMNLRGRYFPWAGVSDLLKMEHFASPLVLLSKSIQTKLKF